MTNITLAPPIVGEKNTTAEPKVGTAIKAVEEFINGKKIDGTSNIKAEGLTEENLNSELKTKLAATLTGVKLKVVTVSTEAATGEMIGIGKSAITITLPAATLNREVVVYAGAGFSGKVKCTAPAKMYGDYTNAAGEVELFSLQHITVQADGTNWIIKAGGPKRTQLYVTKKFTKAELEAGITLNASRPVFLAKSEGITTIGGAAAAVTTAFVPEGQVVKGTFVPAEATFVYIEL